MSTYTIIYTFIYVSLVGVYYCSGYKITPITPPIQHGEGPFYDSNSNTLYFVDTFKATVHRWCLDGSERHDCYKLDGRNSIGFIIPIRNKKESLLVFADREIYYLNWSNNKNSSAKLEHMLSIEKDKPNNQFNDGKADVNGRIWGGTLTRKPDLSVADRGGSFYMFENDFTITEEKITHCTISNGLTWNKNADKFFYIDSKLRTVDVFDFDLKTGTITNRNNLFKLSDHSDLSGIPDGMTIDEDDNLWVALFGGKAVLKICSKTGNILQKIEMPATYITAPTFGGPNFDILYVTTSRLHLNESDLLKEPSAGSVFQISNLGVKGFPPNTAIL